MSAVPHNIVHVSQDIKVPDDPNVFHRLLKGPLIDLGIRLILKQHTVIRVSAIHHMGAANYKIKRIGICQFLIIWP